MWKVCITKVFTTVCLHHSSTEMPETLYASLGNNIVYRNGSKFMLLLGRTWLLVAEQSVNALLILTAKATFCAQKE